MGFVGLSLDAFAALSLDEWAVLPMESTGVASGVLVSPLLDSRIITA